MKLEKLIFAIGIVILLYPAISDWWNSFHQSQVILRYSEKMKTMKEEEYDNILKNAKEYNELLGNRGISWNLSREEKEEYDSVLNMYDDGMMGYIEIPAIDCRLPVYHGTEEAVLQVGAGHLEGSSLPVGGENAHCIVSGHRGLTSARLFTRLDQLKTGDIFVFYILNERFFYEVDQIQIVLPEDTGMLKIERGKDLCTLVTCTPYGVNTHRLLIRGTRVAEINDMENSGDREMKGGKDVGAKNITKWLVLLLLIILLAVGLKKHVHAETTETMLYEIEIQFKFADIEFRLYKIDNNGNVHDSDKGELVSVQSTRADRTAVFSGIEPGRYCIEGEVFQDDSYIYRPVPSVIVIPGEDVSGNRKNVVIPKYEKEELSSDGPVEVIPDDKLPQAGQLWWPVPSMTFIGIILLILGRRRKDTEK